MKYLRNLILGLLAFLGGSQLLLLAVLFFMPAPDFEIEPARPILWDYPSLSEAKISHQILDDGRLQIQTVHPLLPNVTPKMLAWWYKNLALSEATIDGVSYPYYHLFHLSEHGQFSIIQAATDGSPGMGVGAIVYRQETFGPYRSKGQARVERFDNSGFVAIPFMGPVDFGRVEHSFKQVTGGTHYTVDVILGPEIPFFGRAINFFIRNKQFSKPILNQWNRHQVEEVGSLPHFLPKLYQSKEVP